MVNKGTFNQLEKLEAALGNFWSNFWSKLPRERFLLGAFLVTFFGQNFNGRGFCSGATFAAAVEQFADYVRKHLGLS